MFEHIAPYAALLAFFYLYLSARTIGFRRKARVSVGDGGDAGLLRATRVHANFAEYVPLALLLIAFMEAQSSTAWLIHSLGALLVVSRLAHAYGLSSAQTPGLFRVAGMVGTFATLVISATWLITHTFMSIGQ